MLMFIINCWIQEIKVNSWCKFKKSKSIVDENSTQSKLTLLHDLFSAFVTYIIVAQYTDRKSLKTWMSTILVKVSLSNCIIVY